LSADVVLAGAAGVLLALSFPQYGHPALGWVALAPLLVAIAGVPLRRAFLLGLLAGGIYFAGTLYWITRVMAVYGGLPVWIAVLVNVALIAYLALFPAMFALITRRLVMGHGRIALMWSPLVWVVTELGRTWIFTGFPWVLLGYSQAPVLPIAQLASIFGVYGVSMLVASVSAALAVMGTARAMPHDTFGPQEVMYVSRGRRLTVPAGTTSLAAVMLVVLAVALWGSRRAAAAEWTHEGTPVRVGMIQGNVDQAQKWDATRARSIFADYIRMTREAVGQGATFILWPESSTPFVFEEQPGGAAVVRDLVKQSKVTLLLGSDQIERGDPDKFYNSALLIRADGTMAGAYRKMHLVPFGEYVPLQSLLFFAAPLTEQVGTFTAGETPSLLPVDGHPVSAAICYEVVYPELVRRFVLAGSEMLTTITNDAWFGETSAPYQHFAQAGMRAIEEGRYLVRAANTGISGIVDPYGHVRAQTAIYQPAVLVGEARFLRTSTFYARHGDVLAYASVVAVAALLAVSRKRP
jgi:apolipoprotein N-acyltransferase